MSRSTIALILLWTVTAIGVFAAQRMHPAAPVRLSLTADSLAFTLADTNPQLLVGDREVPSLTLSGFRWLAPEGAGTDALPDGLTADAGASLTVRPAQLVAVRAPGPARVRVSRIPEEVHTRLTISQEAARGVVRVPAGAVVRCHRCGDEGEWGWLHGTRFRWEGQAGAGGTDLLLQLDEGTLVISDDDLRIGGDVEMREASGDALVSTVSGGTVELLTVGRSRNLPQRARLTIGGIDPATGLLKRLEVNEQGVVAVIEARLDTLTLEEAGQVTSLLPSYLEIGFQNQRWLYLAQGIVLVGGTLSKLRSAWKSRGSSA